MKKTVVLFLFIFLLFALVKTNSSVFSGKDKIIKYDTLPATDTTGKGNLIDTFGGIKNMNDSNLKAKKDSLLK